MNPEDREKRAQELMRREIRLAGSNTILQMRVAQKWNQPIDYDPHFDERGLGDNDNDHG